MTNIPADLIAEHNQLKDHLAAQSKAFNEYCLPHKTRMEQIESLLHEQLLAMNAGQPEHKRASISTEHGTAYLSTIVTPKVIDKEKYLDWVLDNWDGYGAMLQIGAPQKDAFQEFVDTNNGQLPPHTETSTFIRCNIRRS